MTEAAQTSTTKTRKRKYTHRARTGCETCRIRRIKCDESPGSCRNCTSTGRRCEGYDLTRLPRRRSPLAVGGGGGGGVMTIMADLNTALPARSSDERRCFDVFHTRTIPMFVSLFDSDVWRVVLQMSQSDPSVCHAVVAFSALHEGTLGGKYQAHRPLHSRHCDFALEQYGRALGSLAGRLRSNDPQMRYVALVCCIVFVLFELLNDNYSGVLVHLQNGVNMLANTAGGIETARASIICGGIHPSGSNRPQFEVALRRTFAHLDVQSAYFDRASPAMNIYPGYGDPVNLDDCPVWFDSLYGAKETLDPVLNNSFSIWRLSQPILRNKDPSNGADAYADLLSEQHRMRTYLARHIAAFDEFLTHNPLVTERDIRSRDVILLHQLVIFMNIESCASLSEMIFDAWPAEWTEVVNLIDRIVTSALAEFGPALPNVVVDLGITLPLCWVVLKCRDPVLRQRALDLLRLWPHSEGLHSTLFILNIGQQVSDIECEGMDPFTGVIPEEARIRTVNMERDKDRRRAKLVYSLSDPTAEDLVVRERWFYFEEGGAEQTYRPSGLRSRKKASSEMSSSSSTPFY
ncbi:hypothetical protein BJY00DRAFT_271064 [Aspergillus carlsbadensis]|nr:hypothetical protein BJY00DRAFT_271064 [Aspergillus carlsbadensis]